ncbi:MULTISPECIES: hypothetical protein [Vibrio]|uniref:hypothetical protein n=1 Tax=Vibrio TaxID=662 RepID=UPI000841FC9B|nr:MULTISPECIES: hypothetical protein [Vibrio]ODM56882.1 hypothetical protein BC455_18655 [Vibrio harveyi]USD58476.1 hypothetical protein J4N44_27675 [Vibrio sp. SCSIO 43155]
MNFIYFIANQGGNTSKITVIDLADVTIYERDQFSPVNDDNYHDLTEALADAKAIASKYGLDYVPFESRYNSDLNEKTKLTLLMEKH